MLVGFIQKLLQGSDAQIILGLNLIKEMGCSATPLISDLISLYEQKKITIVLEELFFSAFASIVRTTKEEEMLKLLREIKGGVDSLISIALLQTQGVTVEPEEENSVMKNTENVMKSTESITRSSFLPPVFKERI